MPALLTASPAPGPGRACSRCLRHPDRLDLRCPKLWITRSQVVLLAASPCVLAISVLLAVVAAVGAVGMFGLVIKSEDAFERFGAIRHVAVVAAAADAVTEQFGRGVESRQARRRADHGRHPAQARGRAVERSGCRAGGAGHDGRHRAP